jgi:D-alanyl-D-alanine dipeptidase
MGLRNAAMLPSPRIEAQLARARMWSYDGSESDAPTFQLGMAPAGSLYASVLDLARFMQVVFDGGEGPRGAVIQPDTLERMMTPAAGPDGKPTRFGIGFAIDELDGHKRCGHGGAIYGFSTELSFLPEEGLGVAVATSMDFSNAVTTRIGEHALRALLAARAGEPLPELALSEPFGADRAEELTGRYRAPGFEAELSARGERLLLEWRGLRMEVRRIGDRLVVDDRHEFGIEVGPDPWSELSIAGVTYERVNDLRPRPCPERWREYLGEYGWDNNVLQVRENHGNLEALVEWFFFDRLHEQLPDQFGLAESGGLYPAEHLVFRRDADGQVTHAVLGGVAFARRTPGAPDGETFHIDPLLPPAELRAMALEASAPPPDPESLAPDLVELIEHVPGLALDVRYATTNNFLSTTFYPEARALMQRPAALALAEAQAELRKKGYGLLVHDAYRPWHVTRMFWDATPDEMRHFVADPAEGSRPNRGCTVDLTLVDLNTGEPVLMTGGYDEFSARSYPDYPGGTSLQRWHRELLRSVMESHGFDVYQWEWWHFDYRDWRRYPILDLSFEEALAEPVK